MPKNNTRKGKPKKNEIASGMGRALERSHRQSSRKGPRKEGGMASHAPNIQNIGIEEDKKQLSVLEMDDLTDFLGQAELAGREFTTERERFVVLDPNSTEVRPIQDTKVISWADEPPPKKVDFQYEELSFPRRPTWDPTTTSSQLDEMERHAFLSWRRTIAQQEETMIQRGIHVTPFEKNIEIWRQLWRVLERSSVVVQIVDARNPLFYFSKGLKGYVEGDLHKKMVLLVNKSDFLSKKQREVWSGYLKDIPHFFFSAFEEQCVLDVGGFVPCDPDREEGGGDIGVETPLTRSQLLQTLRKFALDQRGQEDGDKKVTLGMVGFPNVGKSSVINVLLGTTKNNHNKHRVAVASQPGKTKHFQTMPIPEYDTDLILCDCPGLVFPSFVSNTADLIAAGVYPIAHMRGREDWFRVIGLICARVPTVVLMGVYHVPVPAGVDLINDVMTPDQFLTAFCEMRSMYTASSGIPDYQRAARIVIKDYVDGKLLYCHCPPSDESLEHLFVRETLGTVWKRNEKIRRRLVEILPPVDAALKHEASDRLSILYSFINEGGAGEENEEGDNNGDVSLQVEQTEPVDIINDDNPPNQFNDMALEDELLLSTLDLADNDQKPKKKRGTVKRWGKKDRKNRNKDPYGCHSTEKKDAGVVVMGGKYGYSGYTRANYAGVKAALPFESR